MILLAGVLLLSSFILAGCGGGSGSSSPPAPPPPTPRTTSVKGAYWGVLGDQINETYDHVQVGLVMDWGNWDTQQVQIQLNVINQIQQFKARGLRSIVGIGFLTWDSKGNSKGTQYLQVFKTQLEALDLESWVDMFYPFDEPDLGVQQHRITEAQLIDGIQRIHSVFPDIQFMTIYGDHGGFPAKQWFDVVGQDKYGNGPVPPPLGQNQTGAIIAGGANPWREDPEQFYEYAMNHPEISYIIYFMYGDYPDDKGVNQSGIRNNGMLPAYKAVGLKLQGQIKK